VKADMTVEAWADFMRDNPKWWEKEDFQVSKPHMMPPSEWEKHNQ
jgi:hypothetical protein